MASRKLNRRRNKRNTRQKKGKKQTSKLIKCKICNKSKRISRKNYKKLRNAGMNMNDVYKYLCCGGNSLSTSTSTVKPINEKNFKSYKFNPQGRYEPLPSWQADEREKMKMLMNSNKVGPWTVAPPVVKMLYDENNRLVPAYRVLKGRDKMYDPETMSYYNSDKIQKLPIVGNLGDKESVREVKQVKQEKQVKSSKNQSAKKMKRRIPIRIS